LRELTDAAGGEDGRVAGGVSLRTAPGVGKTFAMRAEGRRRAEAGERVVVGWLESHDRPQASRRAPRWGGRRSYAS
jgi:K+-sensing histidine kinase KdpD